MKLRLIARLLLSVPKIIYVNLKLLGLQGLKCPILVSYDTRIAELSYGSVHFEKPSFGCIKIGFDGTAGIPGTGGVLGNKKGCPS